MAPNRLLLVLVPVAFFATPYVCGQSSTVDLLKRVELKARFDVDQSGRLDEGERSLARKEIQEFRSGTGGGRFLRRAGAFSSSADVVETSSIHPRDVPRYPDAALYDTSILRTLFLTFTQVDWRQELADFYLTDVDVPADLHVDGLDLKGVGVRFRGSSSYILVPKGKKKSINLSIDFTDGDQRLYGNRTINLLNSNSDPSMVREVLFAQIAACYLPALPANFVRLVINGEDWGVYVNVQQFNKDFLKDRFGSRKGTRWKALRNFGGVGALSYLGEDREDYRAGYELKTGKDSKSWQRLIKLCRSLHETPVEKLEATLPAILDIDRCLWFLALEWVFEDGDGYVRQGYDYRLLEDRYGRFAPIHYDNNEILQRPSATEEARRLTQGQRPFGTDPLEQLDNVERPLIHRLLAVPAWRARYLAHVRTIVERWTDWHHVGSIIEDLRVLITEHVAADQRKLFTMERFQDGAKELRGLLETRRREVLGQDVFAGPWPQITAVTPAVDATSGGACRLSLNVALDAGPPIEEVLLHYRSEAGTPYQSVRLEGSARIGFSGATPELANGTAVEFYVEARCEASSGTTCFWPEEAEAKPMRIVLRQ